MINFMQMALIKKDIRGIVSKKMLFTTLLIVPLVMSVIIPSIMLFAMIFVPDGASDFESLLELIPNVDGSTPNTHIIIKLILNKIIPLFFLLIPIMVASVMVANSFVGEKEKRTLETLLYSPMTLKQVYYAKILHHLPLVCLYHYCLL